MPSKYKKQDIVYFVKDGKCRIDSLWSSRCSSHSSHRQLAESRRYWGGRFFSWQWAVQSELVSTFFFLSRGINWHRLGPRCGNFAAIHGLRIRYEVRLSRSLKLRKFIALIASIASGFWENKVQDDQTAEALDCVAASKIWIFGRSLTP